MARSVDIKAYQRLVVASALRAPHAYNAEGQSAEQNNHDRSGHLPQCDARLEA